jgi:hypothetical protein
MAYLAYLADILAKLVNRWPVQKLDQLLPWAWLNRPEFAWQLDYRSYSDGALMRVVVWSRLRLPLMFGLLRFIVSQTCFPTFLGAINESNSDRLAA